MQELFLSTSVHRLDAKGRVSVPAGFRSAVAGSSFAGVILYPDHEDAPFYNGCSHERMERYARSFDADGPFSARAQEFGIAFMAAASLLAFDAGGRVVLPDEVIERCDLTDKVCFAGLGATFQLWEPERFEAKRSASRSALPDLIRAGGLAWADRAGSN